MKRLIKYFQIVKIAVYKIGIKTLDCLTNTKKF